MSEVNIAITDLWPVQCDTNIWMVVKTHPPLVATREGEIAIERKTRSIEPRATAAHSPKIFQPTRTYHNLMITLCVSEPIWRRKVADVDDSPEPTKVPGRDLRRG